MLRRFLLVGVMVLAQGSMLQLVIGTLLSAMFLLFQVQASPYQQMSDDFLASASSFAMVAMFLCSYAFKDAALTGLDDIKQRMSEEQRELYVVNQGTLSFIMIASTLGAIAMSIVLFIVQFSIEGARMRREARASKARRLRYTRPTIGRCMCSSWMIATSTPSFPMCGARAKTRCASSSSGCLR